MTKILITYYSSDSPNGWIGDNSKLIQWPKYQENVRRVQLMFKDISFGKHAQIADLQVFYTSGNSSYQGKYRRE